jgi:hypothetical protein
VKRKFKRNVQVHSSSRNDESVEVVSTLIGAFGADASTGVTAEEVYSTGLITFEQYRALSQRVKDDDLQAKSLRSEFERRRALALHAGMASVCFRQA